MADSSNTKTGGSFPPDPGSSGQHPGTSVGLLTPIELQTAQLESLIDALDVMLKSQIAAAKKCLSVVAEMRADQGHPPDKK